MANIPRGDSPTLTVFGVLIRNAQVLMIRRAKEPYQGTLTIPGGHKQCGESLKEACAREIFEETGLTMKSSTLIGLMELERIGDPNDYMSFYFLCRDWEGQLKAGPEGELLWVEVDKATLLPETHPAFKSLAPYLLYNECPFLARGMVDDQGRGQYNISGF